MDFNSPDEAKIIQGIRERNPEVFNYLRKRSFNAVQKVAMSNSGSEEDAEDLYSEGIACLIDSLDDPDTVLKNKVITLFIAICKKQWLMELRKRKSEKNYRKAIDNSVYEEHFEEGMDKAVNLDVFWNSFKQLKEDCQTIIKNFLDGKQLKEIGGKMGLSPAYVKKKKHYCHKSLLNIIYKHPGFTDPGKNESV